MKIAVLGGGITGLTAAYYLAKKGHRVSLFERGEVLGGLAAGFKANHWQWPLERAYHHLFSNDVDIISFTKEIGFNQIFFCRPATASLYHNDSVAQSSLIQCALTTPSDLLRFPFLTWFQKLRVSAVFSFLKISPFTTWYEKYSSSSFLQTTIGKHAWEVLFQELFRKKFGKYAENIVASFIWSRIKKRTRDLGYIEGGFQTLVDFLEALNEKLSIVIKKNHPVSFVERKGRLFSVDQEQFEAVVSTLPTPALLDLTRNLFPSVYIGQLAKLRYLHGHNLILETKTPVLDRVYWLNVMIPDFPFTVLVQHTNLIDKIHYNNRHLLYVGNYIDEANPLWHMNKDEVLNYFLPYLQKIHPRIEKVITQTYLFRGPFAQPIFDQEFLENKPSFETPVKNFYIANLDMTYPHDRGTNYAVKLGREVAALI